MQKKRLSRTWIVAALALSALLVACGTPVDPTATPTPVPAPTETPAPTPTPIPADEPIAFQERFEETLDRWQKGFDLPEDPDRPGQPVDWAIELSPEQTAEGNGSARFFIDGKQDDGTIWLARPFDVAPDSVLRVRLTFDLWSESESFNTLAMVAAAAGSRPPAAEGDFDVSQPANQVTGWKTYAYTFEVRSGPEGQVWVALGISAVWETPMTYYVDDVRVEIAPAESGAPSTDDPTLVLPESAEPFCRASADLNGDDLPEEIALAGWGGGANRLGYDFLQMFVIAPVGPGQYLIAWQSEQLPTDRAEALHVQDLNGDGRPEVLSVQAMGASGETLYVLGWQDEGYGWLKPHGGHFDGGASFGETGARWEDLDSDGAVEILADYGPASAQTDVYGWDEQVYTYLRTETP